MRIISELSQRTDFFIFVISVLVLMLPKPSLAGDTVNFQFDQHLWKHRILVIYSPNENFDTYVMQKKRFRDSFSGFAERDLLLLSSFSKTEALIRDAPDTNPKKVMADSARSIHNRFKFSNNQFMIFLIGKDGTKKLRSRGPVSIKTIFNTIDAMPMRQREMR